MLRRDRAWSSPLITSELAEGGIALSPATVGRWLTRSGINRRRELDPAGGTIAGQEHRPLP
jgi:hypothetical protein